MSVLDVVAVIAAQRLLSKKPKPKDRPTLRFKPNVKLDPSQVEDRRPKPPRIMTPRPAPPRRYEDGSSPPLPQAGPTRKRKRLVN